MRDDGPGTVRPFGLRYAVTPAETAEVDLSSLTYDEDEQISFVGDGGVMVPAMRHTSTQTKTHTGDRSNGDDDTDTTGT
jgi:putative ATP-grasp target RiPP